MSDSKRRGESSWEWKEVTLLSGEGASQVEDGVTTGKPEGPPLSLDSCSAYAPIFRLEMQQI